MEARGEKAGNQKQNHAFSRARCHTRLEVALCGDAQAEPEVGLQMNFSYWKLPLEEEASSRTRRHAL